MFKTATFLIVAVHPATENVFLSMTRKRGHVDWSNVLSALCTACLSYIGIQEILLDWTHVPFKAKAGLSFQMQGIVLQRKYNFEMPAIRKTVSNNKDGCFIGLLAFPVGIVRGATGKTDGSHTMMR